jgi:hypothetical protein
LRREVILLAGGIVLGLAPLPLQALRLMFIVGCQLGQRFPYENVEALAHQSLALPRLSMKGNLRLAFGAVPWVCAQLSKV